MEMPKNFQTSFCRHQCWIYNLMPRSEQSKQNRPKMKTNRLSNSRFDSDKARFRKKGNVFPCLRLTYQWRKDVSKFFSLCYVPSFFIFIYCYS